MYIERGPRRDTPSVRESVRKSPLRISGPLRLCGEAHVLRINAETQSALRYAEGFPDSLPSGGPCALHGSNPADQRRHHMAFLTEDVFQRGPGSINMTFLTEGVFHVGLL